ncbi:MAG: hypothetical protein M0R22_10055, partial [Dehalococcoidia bacterium]|nr:hypothetical protein [Dehalococcoidia bacterium]
MHDVVVIPVFSSETSGNGWADIDTGVPSGMAKKALIEVIASAVLRAVTAATLSRAPDAVIPNVAGYYEVVKDDAGTGIGYRVYFVSHTPEFTFGDAIDQLIVANLSESAKKTRFASQRQAAADAVAVSDLCSKGVGMSQAIASRSTFYALTRQARGETRLHSEMSTAQVWPLRSEHNPGNPSIALSLASAIADGSWPEARKPRSLQTSVRDYVIDEATADSSTLLRAAATQPDPSAMALDVPGVTMAHTDPALMAILGAPPQQQQPGDATAAAQPAPRRSQRLMFPDPWCVWDVPLTLFGHLWEYTRPDKTLVTEHDAGGHAMLFGARRRQMLSANAEEQMASLDKTLAMAFENAAASAERQRVYRDPDEFRRMEIEAKQLNLERFMSLFRVADPATRTPESGALLRFYTDMLAGIGTSGKPTLVRKWELADPTLDGWGNFIAHVRTFTDMVLRNYSTHLQYELIMISLLNAYHWAPHQLQMNILVPGESGVSKTFVFELIKKTLVDGTVTWRQEMSDKAGRTEQCFNDRIVLEDEGNRRFLSKGGANGRQAGSDDETDKSTATSGIIVREVNVVAADGTTRVTMTMSIPNMQAVARATNDKLNDLSDPMRQRNLILAFSTLCRVCACDNPGEFINGAWAKDPALRNASLERIRIIQLLVYLTENFIKVGVFKDVDMAIADRFALKFEAVLREANIPYVARDITRFRMNCRTAAIMNAANELFLSAHSPLCVDEPWSDGNLLLLEPLLVTTESVCAYVMSAHCVALVPDDCRTLAYHAIKGSNNSPPTSTDEQCPATDYMSKNVADAISGVKFSGNSGGGSSMGAYDPLRAVDDQAPDAGADSAGRAQQQQRPQQPRKVPRFDEFDYVKVKGPATALAQAILKSIPNPKPPLALIWAWIQSLFEMTVKARNRAPDGSVLRDRPGALPSKATGNLNFMIARTTPGTHDICALIPDPTNKNYLYIAQDLLNNPSVTPEEIAMKVLAATCHGGTRPRRVVLSVPHHTVPIDNSTLAAEPDRVIDALVLTDADTAVYNNDTGGPVSQLAQSAMRRFPHVARVARMSPVPNRVVYV